MLHYNGWLMTIYMSDDMLKAHINWWDDARYQMTGWCYVSNDGLMIDIKLWVDARYQIMGWC